MTLQEIAGRIDHTNLSPIILNSDWETLCSQAKEHGFKTVAINNAGIELCAQFLKGSSVLVDAAVSFPLGQCTLEVKVFETADAILKGAGEVDYVVNLSAVKEGNWAYIQDEMERIVTLCREAQVVSKVIFENCYLEEAEKIKLCEIASKVKPDFVKTSTGFGTSGATIEDVKLMRKFNDSSIKIKAAGGVRTLDAYLAMVEAGADRIGTSAGLAIMAEASERLNA
jgi:deoxyribose-phosphate aldolase